MSARRFLGSLLATALAVTTLGVVATASPAAAATPTAITSSIGGSWLRTYPSQKGAVAAGDTISFYIDVVSTDGTEDPYAGTVTVQRRLAGSLAWTTVATSTYPGYSGSAKAVANATYRVVYSGGSSTSASWDPASADKSLKVQRKLRIKSLTGRKAGFSGSIKPAKRAKITVYKKQGTRFKKYRTMRSTAKGRFQVVLPAPRRGKFHWKIVFAGDRRFVASTLRGYTYRG
jgi:hypothetical protein